jgi:serine/threonine protein kinase
MCPEIVLKKEYHGPPTDVWASGILLHALLCGQFPFKGTSDKDLYKKIARGLYNIEGSGLSNEARTFLSRMLVVAPAKRATSAELLSDPWLKYATVSNNSEMFLSTNESSQVT